MMLGYARVSTDEQSASLQLDALAKAGCDRIFQDVGVSETVTSRPSLDALVEALQPGDTLVTWRLDRLGRSLAHLIHLIMSLEGRGIAFRSLSEAIDTRTASGRLLFHVMGALAEFERSLISERTKAGVAAARARASILGRPAKLSVSQVQAAALEILESRRSLRAVAEDYAVSPSTLKRAIRALRGSRSDCP
jgi:DNA invertase Pin-like site-specific DNA recombinase